MTNQELKEYNIDPLMDKEIKKNKPIISLGQQDKGVIYLGRIPHGFYEEEMESYFSQFGQVCRLRLSRNKKTGKSKHYAFIEFASRSVAQIVAETMNNYLMFNHKLECKLLDQNQVHADLFKGSGKRFRPVPWSKIAREKRMKPKSTQEYKRLVKSHLEREEAKRLKLKELGVDYTFQGIAKQAAQVLKE